MVMRGRKPLPIAIHQATGTDQPCRRHDEITVPLHGDPVKPKWLKNRASRIWDEKILIYDARRQKVAGYESALAQYCALEASLIDQRTKNIPPAVAEITAYRLFAAEFHDTPASNLTRGSNDKPENKFKKNGI